VISASDPLAWRPCIRRDPDPRQGELFAASAARAYISTVPMSRFAVPPAAVRAEIPHRVPFQIVAPSAEPPDGKGWLHEVKHDGHRLLAIVADGAVRLVSRNGYDRSELFAQPFRALAAAGLPAMVLDGEIAVPDERGVTHSCRRKWCVAVRGRAQARRRRHRLEARRQPFTAAAPAATG
jgi:ATP dependent DNA ligase domain